MELCHRLRLCDKLIIHIINNGKKIGSGVYADIYLCDFTSEIKYKKYINDSKKQISWKIFKCEKKSNDLYRDFLKETSNSAYYEKNDHILSIDNILIGNIYCAYSMELYNGNLTDLMMKKTLEERINLSKQIFEQMFISLYILKKNGIIHRDIKPSNILYFYKDNTLRVKLIDFGLTENTFNVNKKHNIDAYALWLKAPEIILGENTEEYKIPYDYQADIWAMGISLFKFLTGSYITKKMTKDKIINGMLKDCCYDKPVNNFYNDLLSSKINININIKYEMEKILGDKFKLIPSDLIDLLSKMLHYDPNIRINVEDAIQLLNLDISNNNDCITLNEDCKRIDYIALPSAINDIEINTNIKADIFHHMIAICKRLSLDFETIVICLDLFDRFVSINFSIIDNFEIIAYSCLLLASKFVDCYNITPRIVAEWYSRKFKKSYYLNNLTENLVCCQKAILIDIDHRLYNNEIDILIKKIYELIDKYEVDRWFVLNELVKINTSKFTYQEIIDKLIQEIVH